MSRCECVSSTKIYIDGRTVINAGSGSNAKSMKNGNSASVARGSSDGKTLAAHLERHQILVTRNANDEKSKMKYENFIERL